MHLPSVGSASVDAMKDIEMRGQGPGWLVVDKPAGLLSAPGRHVSDSVVTRLQASGTPVLTVHRLDMDTSGLLLVATDPHVHRALSMQFQERSVEKATWPASTAACRGTRARLRSLFGWIHATGRGRFLIRSMAGLG